MSPLLLIKRYFMQDMPIYMFKAYTPEIARFINYAGLLPEDNIDFPILHVII